MSDTEDTDRPDHLPPGGAADRTLDLDEFLEAVEHGQVSLEEILRSNYCPQPYDRSEETVEEWEEEFTIEAHRDDDGEKVYRLRVEGEGSDSERYIEIDARWPNLEDVV